MLSLVVIGFFIPLSLIIILFPNYSTPVVVPVWYARIQNLFQCFFNIIFNFKSFLSISTSQLILFIYYKWNVYEIVYFVSHDK